MDFALTDEQIRIQSYFAQFARQQLEPIRKELETNMEQRRLFYRQLASEGICTLTLRKDPLAYLLSLIEIAKVDAGVAVAISVTNLVAEAIESYGTQKQKEQYLGKMAQTVISTACFAMTEPTAGSDPKAMRIQAKRTESGYELTGVKQFITNGDLADLCLVFGKVDGQITAFLVERGNPGWHVHQIERKLGLLTVSLVDLTFDHCFIPFEQRLGEEGAGLKIGLGLLDRGRLSIAAQAVGIAEAALEAAADRAHQREQFGQPIIQFQAIAFKLADMKVKLDAARLLLYRAAWCYMQGQPFTVEASIAKLFASESANFIASEALQIFGGYGYVDNLPLERYFRDARATTIYEGTSEIQRLVISRIFAR